MRARIITAAVLVAGAIGVSSTRAATASFDDLSSPPPTTGQTGLFYANGDSLDYAGVLWDARFTVVGNEYRVQPATTPPGPLYGLPHSGSYFVSNGGDGGDNDGLLITTNQVLMSAWFGRNEYYGYGPGADQVTIVALRGAAAPVALTFDLPPGAQGVDDPDDLIGPGQPGVMVKVDTRSFASLSGITGYRIDRRMVGELNGNWVADDFVFAAPVPEPQSVLMLAAGLGVIAWRRRRGRA